MPVLLLPALQSCAWLVPELSWPARLASRQLQPVLLPAARFLGVRLFCFGLFWRLSCCHPWLPLPVWARPLLEFRRAVLVFTGSVVVFTAGWLCGGRSSALWRCDQPWDWQRCCSASWLRSRRCLGCGLLVASWLLSSLPAFLCRLFCRRLPESELAGWAGCWRRNSAPWPPSPWLLQAREFVSASSQFPFVHSSY